MDFKTFHISKTSLLLVFSILIMPILHGQENQIKRDSTKEIIIENADLQEIILETEPPIQKLLGNVRAFHEGAYFFADSAIIIDKDMFAYGDVTIIQNDTTVIYGDSLKYYGNDKKAFVYGKVILENGGEKLSTPSLVYDLNTKTATYDNKAILENPDYTVKSKRGIYDTENKIAYFYENVSVDGEDFRLVNDSLVYRIDTKVTSWKCPTLINEGASKIYSEIGYYDLNNKNAQFTQNAQFVDDNSTTIGDTILYVDSIKTITVKGNAQYTTDSDTAKANTIIYNKDTEISTLQGNAEYKSVDNFAFGDLIIYNKKNDSYNLVGKSMVSDPPVLIYGNDINYNKKDKSGLIIGDVIWRDTSSKTDIICDSLIYEGTIDYAKAIGFDKRPLMIAYGDEDTLFLSADTLMNNRKFIQIDSATIDTVSYLIGDNDVRIFSKNYQAVGDSLSYNKTDSLFTLMNRPIVWQDTTQMVGDTIWMQMKNGELNKMNLRPNAMIINSTDLIFFNQIKGNKIDIDFKQKKIDQLKVNGNAQSIYYMLDDVDAYIGVNQTDCSLILFNFEDGKIATIRYYTEPTSNLLPMKSTNHEQIKLGGFKWWDDIRPKSQLTLRDKP